MTIYWRALPLDDESNRVSKLLNYSYEVALMPNKDVTDMLIKRFEVIRISKQNFIESIFGTQGSGKSYIALFLIEKLCKILGKEISMDNIAFTVTDLLKKIENCDSGDVFLLDEQIHLHGYGSSIERQSLDNVEMTVRENKLCFFFLCPKWVTHNYHFVLETWEMGKTDSDWDFSIPIEKQWNWTKSVIFDNKEHAIGHVVTGSPSNKELLIQYEKTKHEFIEDIKKRRAGKRPLYILDKAYELCEIPDFIHDFVTTSRTASLKKNLILVKLTQLGGSDISIEECGRMQHLIEYIIIKEPRFKEGYNKAFRELIVEKMKQKILEQEIRKEMLKRI